MPHRLARPRGRAGLTVLALLLLIVLFVVVVWLISRYVAV
jgi:hypothetical protein